MRGRERGRISARKNIRDQRSHITDARHQAGHHRPGELGSMDRRGLLDDGADAVRLDDAPDEEGDAGNRRDDGLQREEVAAEIGYGSASERDHSQMEPSGIAVRVRFDELGSRVGHESERE